GSMTWTGGTISGSGALNAQGGLTLGAAAATDLEFLSGRTLNNAAAATLAALNSSYGLWLASGAIFDNKPGASFTLLTDARIDWNGSSAGTFTNEGSFVKQGGTGTSFVFTGFNQSGAGTTQVQSGTLSLRGGGSLGGGTLSASAGATLDFSTGTYSIA